MTYITAYGGILVDDQQRILLRKPSGGFGGYAWTFPKGRPDPKETPEETALREVNEEAGYVAEILGTLTNLYVGSTGTTMFYMMRPVSTRAGPLHETECLTWTSIDHARKLVGETKNASGRKRDLLVLDDVEKWMAANQKTHAHNDLPGFSKKLDKESFE